MIERDESLAVEVNGVGFRYGDRRALDSLSLSIRRGEIFAVLGPNGGGKTTLFRLLSTIAPLQDGAISVLGFDVARELAEVRRRIGVVFQAPGLDRKLTVGENLAQHAVLYGVRGSDAKQRIDDALRHFGLSDRADEMVETLSGGLKRRVELAKGLLHSPRLLLLDEPSTGLDPGARADLWNRLTDLRNNGDVTIAFTTHLLEEAERADRIAILDQGRLVALDSPTQLRSEVGGDTITIHGADCDNLSKQIAERFSLQATRLGEELRFEIPDGHSWVSRLIEAFGDEIETIKVGKPTLEDVFIAKTGRAFWNDPPLDDDVKTARKK